jgi:hypothetical protein
MDKKFIKVVEKEDLIGANGGSAKPLRVGLIPVCASYFRMHS